MLRIVWFIVLSIFASVALFTPKADDSANQQHTSVTGESHSANVSAAQVLRVIDGDTIEIKNDVVRIIGIDTPEMGGNGTKEECFAKEASEYVRSLIDAKTVELHPQIGENRDKYGRLLRYVHWNGEDIGRRLIAEGYAKNYPWFPHPRKEAYASAEEGARSDDRGLWKACVTL